jgi:molybdopterin-synthase adenylyltransferase
MINVTTAMRMFVIKSITSCDDNPFDRQERISWWDQHRLSEAKIMVVGAGAIGNETLKNLALLGFQNIFIVDFDTIAASNLSRTVLFRSEDIGQRKSEVAAERTRQMCVAASPRIEWFHGDVVWDLGTGVFRAMDVVLGCLDNVETRFAVNRQCRLAQKPWIDAGIVELAAAATVYLPNETPCYQCGASAEKIKAARLRYSCDHYKQELVAAGRVPTVQIAAAISSALQVQETVKLICGEQVQSGQKILFQGRKNELALLKYTSNPECYAHVTYPEVTSTPLGRNASVRQFLELVSQEEYSGDGATLDLRGDRTFLRSAPCVICGTTIELLKPAFRLFRHEVVCGECRGSGKPRSAVLPHPEARQVSVGTFCLANTEERLLDLRLCEIGVPYLHVLAVHDKHEQYQYYELSGDKEILFPNWLEIEAKNDSRTSTMDKETVCQT